VATLLAASAKDVAPYERFDFFVAHLVDQSAPFFDREVPDVKQRARQERYLIKRTMICKDFE
jgi:hypothetical protein